MYKKTFLQLFEGQIEIVSLASLFCKLFALSFRTFPCLVKLFVVNNAHGIIAFLKPFLALVFALLFLDELFEWIYLKRLTCSSFPPLSNVYS